MKLPSPIAITVDTREQRPYRFTYFKKEGVAVTKKSTLPAGDYMVSREDEWNPSGLPSLEQLSQRAVVERKSLGDLYGTLTRGRRRFVHELEKLSRYGFAAVVIESELSQIANPNDTLPWPTNAKPKSIVASILAWGQRFNVHFYMCPGRENAEVITFRILERWIRDQHRQRNTKTQ